MKIPKFFSKGSGARAWIAEKRAGVAAKIPLEGSSRAPLGKGKGGSQSVLKVRDMFDLKVILDNIFF
jgi:hypothetical protein